MGLTNPGIAYPDPNAIIDPSTGMPLVTRPPQLRFFPNAGARDMQFAQDSGQALQPASATVDGQIYPGEVQPPPQVGMQQEMPSLMPKMFKPTLAQTMTDSTGLPAPINSGETKLGKLIHILTAAARGAAAGSGGGNFGEGFQMAQQAPIQQAAERQQLQTGQLQNQAAQQQAAMMPYFLRQKQITDAADLAQTQAQTAHAQAQTKYEYAHADQLAAKPDPIIKLQDAYSQAVQKNDTAEAERLADAIQSIQPGHAVNRDDRAIAIMQKPPAQRTADESTYLDAYNRWVKETKVDPRLAAANVYVGAKLVQVEDPKTGAVTYLTPEEVKQKNAEAAAANTTPPLSSKTNLQKNAFTPQARIKDVERVSTQIEGSLGALDQDPGQRLLIVKALNDPSVSTVAQFISSGFASQLSPKSREYVTSVLSMREQIMGLNQLLTGSSGTSDARTKAIWDTLPNGSEPDSDMGRRKMKLVRGMIGNVKEAFPLMKLIPGGQDSAQPVYARNPKTGERVMTLDGGKTWQQAK